MLGHGGSSAGSYLADPTSPIPLHCAAIILFQCRSASIAVTGTLRVNGESQRQKNNQRMKVRRWVSGRKPRLIILDVVTIKFHS